MNATEGGRQIVVFGLGEEEYALAISEVQEIIRFVEPRSVASDAEWILGVISLRGKIIPICDLAKRLGVSRGERQATKIIVVEVGEHTVGLAVDDVTEVLTVDADDIEVLRVAGSGAHSIVKAGERLIVLLASEGILDSDHDQLADAV
jgi:purine-binding chemotaxis protein CheW